MTANNFDLAPAQTAGTTTASLEPQPTPKTPTKPRNTTTAQAPDAPTDSTLGGVLVPGGAITGLIGLCWLIHQFGLPAVILGLIACAAAATTALAIKGRRAVRKTPGGRSVLRSNGGGGPSRGTLNGPSARQSPSTHRAGGSPTRTSTGNGRRSAAGAGSPLSGTGAKPAAKNTGTAGGAARKPGGTGASKLSPTRTPAGKRNTAPKPTSLGKPAAATGGTLGGGHHGPAKKNGKHHTAQHSGKTRRGLLDKLRPAAATGPRTASGDAPTGRKNTKDTKKGKHGADHRKATPQTPATRKNTSTKATPTSSLSRILNRKHAAKPVTDKGHHKTRPTPGTPTNPSSPKEIKAAKKLDKAARNNKRHTGITAKPDKLTAKAKSNGKKTKPWKTPASNPHKAPIGPMRRGTYWAGKKLRKHTSRKTRMRIKKITGPTRIAARNVNRIASPVLARVWRYSARGFLQLHMALGSVRYTNAGPNWLHPMAGLLHTITSPLAKAIAVTGSWGWLNRWMYTHTQPRLAAHGAPAPGTPSPTAPIHQPNDAHEHVTSPQERITVSLEAAAPLEQAAEAVRDAGLMLMSNPSENMVGYEATLHALAQVQYAVQEALQRAGETTQENFAVNPAVSEAYTDSAVYAGSLGDRLTEIPTLYRSLHEEQVHNIENPTPQARKWDIGANE
ncbi:hypothetical protein [Streptomyces lydicus]|uniref:hypothetical protein n=1 Tax=Streptomyces lydicus TaxID=47763 RepID=UPI0037A94DB4